MYDMQYDNLDLLNLSSLHIKYKNVELRYTIEIWIFFIWLILFLFRYASGVNLTGFCHSSQLKVADFSYNFFVGSVPKCLKYLPRYSIDLLVKWVF